MTTYGGALVAARKLLQQGGCPSPALDARLLLCAASGLDTAALIAGAGEEVPALAQSTFRDHLLRRVDGEPVARILGAKEFWGLPFEVSAATLVPRPDTETLVEAVLACARHMPAEISICDLGTGSGAILMALLSELPQARGFAVDISQAALAIARRNAERLGMSDRISFHHADFSELDVGHCSVIVSNPPYIRSDAIAALDRGVRDFEPRIALDGGADGLAAYRAILARAEELVAPGGLLAFEVGHDQASAVAALCRAEMLNGIAVRSDLSGIGRVVVATMPV